MPSNDPSRPIRPMPDSGLPSVIRLAGRCAAAGLVLCVVGAGFAPAFAQRTTFNPSVRFDYEYTDNARILEDGTAKPSDTAAALGVSLPFQRDLRGDDFVSFSLQASRRQYQSFGEFDHTDVGASAQYSKKTRGGFAWDLQGRAVQSQKQAQPDPGIGDADFLSRRVEQRAFGVRTSFADTIGRRWNWRATADAVQSEFDRVDDAEVPTDPTAATPEGRTVYGAGFGVGRKVTRKTQIGARLGYRVFDLDLTPDETVQRLGVSVDHQFTENFSLRVGIGAFRRSSDGDEDALRTEGVSSNFGIDYGRAIKKFRFSFDLGVRPSDGGAILGTSNDTTAALSVSRGDSNNPWSWGASIRHTHRVPTERALESTDTVSLGTSVERVVGKRLSLRLGVSWAEQSGSTESAGNDASVYTGRFGLVWYPFRRGAVRI